MFPVRLGDRRLDARDFRMGFRRFSLICLLAAVAFSLTTQSKASITPLLVTGANIFEDDDYETYFLDADSDGLIDVGDRFVGVIVMQKINGTGVGSAGMSTATGVFAIEAYSKV